MASQLSNNLIQFRTIILSLISYNMHPKLETLIEKLTPKTSDATRFLIKMEIKRLAKPCFLVLDFRPYFDNCQPVQHQNICHYLDEISKVIFFDSVENNNNQFSIHMYNELSSQAKERHLEIVKLNNNAKAHCKISIDEIQSLPLVNNNIFLQQQVVDKSRCMLFSYDPLGMSNKGKLSIGIEVNTLDLNASSCVIKTPLQTIAPDNKIVFLWFFEHAISLNYEQKIVLKYTVEAHKKTQSGNHSHYLLKLSPDSETNMIIAMEELLACRLQLQSRYEENYIQPLIDSVSAKSHEQFFIDNTVDIPMICANYQTGWQPSSGLKTPSNKKLWQFFCDDTNHDSLVSLFCNEAIQDTINNNDSFDDYAYVIKHQYQDTFQFIIIWQSQLNNDYSARSLLSKYLLNSHFIYIRLRTVAVNSAQDAYVPSAVPNDVSSTMAILNRPHSKKASALLKASSQMAVLSDVSELINILPLAESLSLQNTLISNEQAIQCANKFILGKLLQQSPMEVINVEENDYRNEDRFEYELALKLTRCENQTLSITGVTKNISSKGLLISLDAKFIFKPGAEVRLEMKIPYRGKILSMPNQLYQVLEGKNHNSVRLTIIGSEEKHAACLAIRELIYLNMDKMPVSGFEQGKTYGMQKAMRNVYANNHLSVPFFIHQDKRQWYISSVAMNQHTKLDNLKDTELTSKEMLMKMLQQESFRNYCLSLLNKININSPTVVFYTLALPRKRQDSPEYKFWFSDLDQLKETGRLIEVFEKIRDVKNISVLRVQLSKPSRIMDRYYRDELDYLEQISADNAQDLLNNISLINGIGEITDHTQQIFHLLNSDYSETELAYVI